MPRAAPVALTALVLVASPLVAGCGGDDGSDVAATTTAPVISFSPGGAGERPAATTGTSPATPSPGAAADDAGRGAGGQDPSDRSTAPSGPTEQLTPPDAAPPARTPTETTVKRPEDPVWCPGDAAGKGGAKAAARFDTRVLLGLRTAEAAARSRKEGCAMRVVRRDGQDLVRTLDFSSTRVNVTETKGRIVRIDSIG